MRDLAQDCGEYLSALPRLRSLTFFDIRIEHIGEEEFRTCFSAFRETLTCLSLEAFTFDSFGAFVTLVDHFPNIKTLQLSSSQLEHHGGGLVPSLSRPLRGKLRARSTYGDFQSVPANRLGFFSRFAMLDLEYEELVIASGPSSFTKEKYVESVLQISPSTVKFLRLIIRLRRE